ncbi:MAG: hypothetical protein ABFS17_10765 [Chloroflexota bacterium]
MTTRPGSRMILGRGDRLVALGVLELRPSGSSRTTHPSYQKTG